MPSPSSSLLQAPVQVSGSIYTSLQFLPRWYQAIGVGGIIFLVYLRHNPIVAWLVTNLHFSFGTQYLWYGPYQAHLENMSFNERLGFTFYGVALAGISFALFHFFIWRCQSFVRGELFPDKPGYNNMWFLFFCAIETARLRVVISSAFEEPGSPAYYALRHLQRLPTIEDPLLFMSDSPNYHYIIQRTVLEQLIKKFITRHLPIFVVSGVYRLLKDVPRKLYVSLRWYMATCSCTYAVMKLLLALLYKEWDDTMLWISMLSTGFYLSIVNYTYGPSKRAGMTKATSYAGCFKMACVGLSVCLLMWVVSLLTMLAVCVSVHVFELILIWMGIFLTVVWVPAVVDSFATSYIVILSGVTAYIGYGMEVLTSNGVTRYWLLVSVLWINVCLVYNFLLNLFCSRSAALLLLLVALGALSSVTVLNPLYMQTSMEQIQADAQSAGQPIAERYFLFVLKWLTDLCELKSTFTAPDDALVHLMRRLQLSDSPVVSVYLGFVLLNVMFSCVVLLMIKLVNTYTNSPAKAKKLQRQHINTLTPIVFISHMARGVATLVVTCIFTVSYITVKDILLPRYAVLNALPHIVGQLTAFTTACLILGFLDCGEVIYETLIRALALRDPPQEKHDIEEIPENVF